MIEVWVHSLFQIVIYSYNGGHGELDVKSGRGGFVVRARLGDVRKALQGTR